eukprot:scaffold4837_cov163-Ochromonas_danica.AAC.4
MTLLLLDLDTFATSTTEKDKVSIRNPRACMFSISGSLIIIIDNSSWVFWLHSFYRYREPLEVLIVLPQYAIATSSSHHRFSRLDSRQSIKARTERSQQAQQDKTSDPYPLQPCIAPYY